MAAQAQPGATAAATHEAALIWGSSLVLAALAALWLAWLLRRAVRRGQAQLHASLDAAPVPMAVNNSAGQILHLNQAFIRSLGYTLADIPTLAHWFPLAYPEASYRASVVQQWQQRLAHTLAQGTPFEPLEVQVQAADGRTLTMLASAAPVPGTADLHLVTLMDLTERQQAQQALARLTERYQLLFERSPDAYLLVGEDGQVLDCNQGVLTMMRAQREQLIGRTPVEISPPQQPDGQDSASASRLIIERIQRQGQHRFEWMHRRLDGTDFWAEVNVSVVEIAQRPLMLAAWRDISLTKRLERQLRQEVEKNRILLQNASDGIAILDTQGRVLEVSQSFCELLGQPREAVMAMHVTDWDTQFSLTEVQALIRQQIAENRTLLFDTTTRHRDGRILDIEVSSRPFKLSDQDLVFTSVRDITQRRQLAQELESYRQHLEQLVASRTLELAIAKEAAEAANKAKTAFLSMVSHELRTPLNGIMGTIGLALRQSQEPRVREYLAIADRSSHHLLSLIEDLLEISRIEADRMALEATAFGLGDVLRQVQDAVAEPARLKGLTLRLDAPPALLEARYIGDARRLTQVLMNLAGNAVKFTERGTVTLHAQAQPEADTRGARVRLHLAVSDTGIGIRSSDLQRIFEPFEQVDTSVTRRFGGTGLGLFISRKLVRAMGAELRVQSQEAQGSRFDFELTLPVAPTTTPSAATPDANRLAPADPRPIGLGEEEALSQQAESALRQQHAGARVLLVEDEPINQAVTRELLESAGLVVSLAADGQDAVALASTTTFDLVLMDVNMQHMDGLEATRQLRALPLHQNTPIIALTANAFDTDRQACLHAGMNTHLGKPVLPSVLYRTVHEQLAKPPRAPTRGVSAT